MVDLSRVRVLLTGFPGGPGVSTFYFLDTATALPSLYSMYLNIAPRLPSDVTVTIDPSGDKISSVTGEITGAWGGDPQAQVVGSDAGVYGAAQGGLITWETNTILDKHRVRGRTFFVPLVGSSFFTNGSLAPSAVADLRSVGASFVISQSSSFVIWHRPFKGSAATATRPARAPHVGGFGLVTGHSVPAKGAILRSRRD